MFARNLLASFVDVTRVGGSLERVFEGILSEQEQLDVTSVLMLLAVEGGARYPGDLATAISRPNATVTHHLNRLTGLGFLRVVRDEVDARRRLIRLTPAGEEVLASSLAALADGLAAQRVTEAKLGLAKLRHALDRVARELSKKRD